MGLRFEHKEVNDKRSRGLASVARQTFHFAYAGDVEFGSYFRVSEDGDEVWRWTLYYTDGESDGWCKSEAEVQSVLNEAYDQLLLRARLVEAPAAADKPSRLSSQIREAQSLEGRHTR